MEQLFVRLNIDVSDMDVAERLLAAIAETVNTVLGDAVDDCEIYSLHVVDESGAALV